MNYTREWYIKQMRAVLQQIVVEGKLGRVKFSLSDIRDCERCYHAIIEGENPTFVTSNVKFFMDACYIDTVPHGTGWKVVI